MNVLKLTVLLLLGLSGTTATAQNLYREVKFTQVDSLINAGSERLTVVNFWATWCKPCVAELPYFRQASEVFSEQPVDFVFVSLDFTSQIQSKLVPFLEKDPLPGVSWWLNERKLQPFIDKIDPDWSGAIPFTLFLNGNASDRSSFEGEITPELLERKIAKRL